MKRAIRHSSTKTICISLAAGISPIIISLIPIYTSSNSYLSNASNNAIKEADRRITVMLDEAAIASRELIQLAGSPCATASRRLRELVASNQFLRVTNLAIDNKIYCSSLYDAAYTKIVEPNNYFRGSLRLLPEGPATRKPILVLRTSTGNKSSYVGIDGRHISDVLSTVNTDSNVVFKVGNEWMRSDGVVRNTPFENYPIASKSAFSPNFGYTLYSAFPEGTLLTYALKTYSQIVFFLAILGVAAGITVYWLLGRVLAPSIELQRALLANEFVPYFQPIISSTSGKCVGCEVLIRWIHPQEGIIPPTSFIPLTEASGLIVPITKNLMQTTAISLVPLVAELDMTFHVGLNISAKHFETLDLVDDCATFLKYFQPGKLVLVLEITERELIKPSATAITLIEKLHNLGVKIALDDFGTGHSSLSYLQNFKVDYLKIDRSFVSMIGTEALSIHILDSILDLALKLDLQVIAEGVETIEQQDYLGACGVDFMQGFLYAKPMSIEDFSKSINH